MRVLVTGARGYVGGRLVTHLAGIEGFAVQELTRSPTGSSAAPGATTILQGDLTRPETLRGHFELCDAVVHLAALNEIECAERPRDALRVNVEGTLNLLEALPPTLGHFIYMSTFHVYGANGEGRVTEETQIAPVHPYAVTHAMAELYVSMYARQRGFEATILRLSNAVGAPARPDIDRWSLVANDLCRQAARNGRLVLRTHGQQQRDFIHIADVVAVVAALLGDPGAAGGVHNLGSGRSRSILSIAGSVRSAYSEITGRTISIDHPDPPVDLKVEDLEFVCDRIGAMGYGVSTSLEEGVRETMTFCLEHFSTRGAD